MDFWGALFLFFFIFCMMSCCGFLCTKKQRGAVLSTPVVVTSATHIPPSGTYATQQMPMPGAGYQTSNVYTAPYPTQGMHQQMPMPMPMGGHPAPPGMYQNASLYPPAASGSNVNPPSYDAVIAGTGAGHPNAAPYEKQSPYNPSFTAH